MICANFTSFSLAMLNLRKMHRWFQSYKLCAECLAHCCVVTKRVKQLKQGSIWLIAFFLCCYLASVFLLLWCRVLWVYLLVVFFFSFLQDWLLCIVIVMLAIKSDTSSTLGAATNTIKKVVAELVEAICDTKCLKTSLATRKCV